MRKILLTFSLLASLFNVFGQNTVFFDAISFPSNGPNAYRIYVSYDMLNPMISLDFSMNYDSTKFEVIDVALTPDGVSNGLIMTWNDFNSEKLYVSSYNLQGTTTTNALIYVDINVLQGVLVGNDIDSISALLNGSVVNHVTSVNNVVTNISNPELKEANIFPNPASDFINVSVDQNLVGGSISIQNTVGQMILTSNLISTSTQLDLSSLDQGIYFISISKQDQKIIKKINIR
ncbi:MAG: T9SS type A sorting domain-containing protein [Flavobacteriales bacterium]|nr:T9SS type A sorting domain-containing protein [Flavobacteriales bacterium]